MGHYGMFGGIMGCSRGVPGLSQAVPGCSGGVPGVFRGVPGVFRGCSGFYRHPKISLPRYMLAVVDFTKTRSELSGNVCKSGPLHFGSEKSFPSNFAQ